MEIETLDHETSTTATTPTRVWSLKRYGRFLPNGNVKASGRGCAWKVRGREPPGRKLQTCYLIDYNYVRKILLIKIIVFVGYFMKQFNNLVQS